MGVEMGCRFDQITVLNLPTRKIRPVQTVFTRIRRRWRRLIRIYTTCGSSNNFIQPWVVNGLVEEKYKAKNNG